MEEMVFRRSHSIPNDHPTDSQASPTNETCSFPVLTSKGPSTHILTQNLYYNYYDPKTKYLIIGYVDPLGSKSRS